MIFEQAGMFSTFHRTTASDQLSHILANALVGNSKETATLEMTFVPAVIYFDEPTLIALTGADFHAYTKDKDIRPYKVHLMEQGDILKFKKARKGTRVYMAIAGGIQLPEVKRHDSLDGICGLLKDGDVFELKRNYSPVQKQLFTHLLHKKETSWGVDAYSLAQIYFSDVFHIMEAEDTVQLSTEQKEVISHQTYEVTPHFNRAGFILESTPLDLTVVSTPKKLYPGTIQLNPEGQLIVLQNELNKTGHYPQIAKIATYHLPKLSQKKPGSNIVFKWHSPTELEQSAQIYERWVKSLLIQIDYQLKHSE